MSVLRHVFGIPTAHHKKATGLFLYSCLTSASYVTARTTGDSLFLSQRGSDALPSMFVLSAVVVAVTMAASVKLGQKSRIQTIAIVTRLLLAMLTFILAGLDQLPLTRSVAVSGLYLFAEIRGCLNTVQLTSLLTEQMPGRRARHSYAFVTAGAPLAGILMGTIIGLSATWFPSIDWLVLTAVIDLLALIPLVRSDFNSTARTTNSALRATEIDWTIDGKPTVFQSGSAVTTQESWLLPMSVLIAAKFFALTVISFQWKVATAEEFHADEEGMTAYFAQFQAFTNLIMIGLQLFVSGRLLSYFGTVRTLLTFPVILLIVGLCLLQSATSPDWFRLLTIARAMDVYRRAFHDTSLAVIYSAFDVGHQRRVIAIMNGVIKPAAEATAGILLAVISLSRPSFQATAFWLPIIPVWLVAATTTGHRYKQLRDARLALQAVEDGVPGTSDERR